MGQTLNTPMRILVLDNEDANLVLMTAALRKLHAVVDPVKDGATAIDRLTTNHYDVVLLDLMMPKPNGFEVIRQMKNRHPEMLQRTIVVTSATSLLLKHFDNAALVRRIVQKPFQLGPFLNEVAACANANRPQEREQGIQIPS